MGEHALKRAIGPKRGSPPNPSRALHTLELSSCERSQRKEITGQNMIMFNAY